MDHLNETFENLQEKSTVDLRYLTALCDGDQDFMAEMIHSFITDIPVTLHELKQQVTHALWRDASKSAHQMKPSMQFMGLLQTLDRVKAVEYYCKEEHHLSELSALVAAIERDIQQAVAELKEIYPM